MKGFNHCLPWPTHEELIARTKKNATGCMLWQGYKSNGYGKVTRYTIQVYTHRLSKAYADSEFALHLFNPEVLCRHQCHNPACLNPNHILIGTQKDNMQDCVKSGRICRGQDRPETTLINKDVREIRRLCSARKLKKKDIAVRYGIHQSTISNILSGYSWKHLK